MEQKNDLMRWKDKIAEIIKYISERKISVFKRREVKKETDLAILQISVRDAEKL